MPARFECVIRGIEPLDQQMETFGPPFRVQLAGPRGAQAFEERSVLFIPDHRVDDAAVQIDQQVAPVRHAVPSPSDFDHQARLKTPVTQSVPVLLALCGHLTIPVQQDPIAKQRLQHAGEQGRQAFADVEQQAREGQRFAFAQYARKPAIDIFAASDLLI